MKKKLWLLPALAGSILCAALGLTGCVETGNSGNNPTDNPPVTHTHVWSEDYTEDGEEHYQTCNGCEEKKYAEHDYSNGDCVCGKENPNGGTVEPPEDLEVTQDGLKYGWDASLNGYSLYGVDGEKSELAQANIPSEISGYPVTGIGDHAFADCSLLTSVTIPDSVVYLAAYAFHNCSSLTSVTIGNGVTGIEWHAFHNCSSLTSIVIPDGVTDIGDYAFYNCSSLTSIVIPGGVMHVGNYAFTFCSSLTSVVIPDSVDYIGAYVFSRCNLLTNIVIPDSVPIIGEGAFYDCSSLMSVTIGNGVTSIKSGAFAFCYSFKNVYYKGKAEEWKAIEISNENDCLISATRYFYSETEPTEEGNYWHYGEDGVTVVVW